MDTRNARLGRRLFFVYLIFYTAYVLVTAFSPTTMDKTIAGVNLSIWSGAALIVAAVVMAVIYGLMCDGDDRPSGEVAHVGHRNEGTVDV